MRFLMRGLLGLALFAVMVAAVGYGAYQLRGAMQDTADTRRSQPRERTYTVNAAVLEPVTVAPEITAFGQIESWRTLQVRASSEGRLVAVADKFRDGVAVKTGDLLVKIDPADADSKLLDAQAALADAGAQKAEAEEAIVVAEQELVAARRQLALRKQALERQTQLREKGYSTMVQVEQEELSVAALEQSLNNRLQSVITARKRVERMDFTVKRAEITLADAERTLKETQILAPFDGLLDSVDATLGRRVSPNETLALLIDPSALEARFTVSTRQFARLIDGRNQLVDAAVAVQLELGDRIVEVPGHLDRAAAIVGEGEGGRTLYASLNVGIDTVLRPGDFITARIVEPELTNVARIPASAATEDGKIFLIGEGDRLEEVALKILRRLGDELIVAEAPFGKTYVTARLPQLGPGIRVKPRLPDDTRKKPEAGPKVAAREGNGAGDTVQLDAERKAALIARIEQSPMPERRKERLRQLLDQPEVPRDLIERIESGRGRRG